MCICGPSAAGKTTLAARLAEQLRARGRHPLLISCDNYYLCGWSPNSRYGFDTVDAIDADQQGMTPRGTQLLGQTGGQGGLAGRRRPADAHQRN